MSDADDLARRVRAAFDRITAASTDAAGRLIATPEPVGTDPALEQALDAERAEKRALEDRLAAAEAGQDEAVSGLRAEIETLASDLAQARADRDGQDSREAGLNERIAELEAALAQQQSDQDGRAAEADQLRTDLADLESEAAELQDEIAELKEALVSRDAAVARVREVNGRLRGTIRELRQAQAKGLSDPGLVDQSMAMELEALSRLQASDRAELDDIIATLTPIVEEAERA